MFNSAAGLRCECLRCSALRRSPGYCTPEGRTAGSRRFRRRIEPQFHPSKRTGIIQTPSANCNIRSGIYPFRIIQYVGEKGLKGLHKFVKLFPLLQHLDSASLRGGSGVPGTAGEIPPGLHFYYLGLEKSEFMALYKNVLFSKKTNGLRRLPRLLRMVSRAEMLK